MIIRKFMKKYTEKHFFRLFSSSVKQTPAEYCLKLVRENDYENFLCTMLLPHTVRAAAFAIRAFNVEVALVEDRVSEKNIGMMRLKFWEDVIDRVYKGHPPNSPVALELDRLLKKHSLSKRYFKRLIEARLKKLSTTTFRNLELMEDYSENSVSSIYYLLLEAHGTKDINADHFASHLGKAHGIVTLIRSIPYNSQRRILVLPEDILMKNSVSSEAVFRRTCNQGFRDTIFEVASRAKQHIDKALSLKHKVKDTHIIFLPLIIVNNYLEKLRKADFDIYHSSLSKRNNLLPLQLYWKKLITRPF